MRQLLFRIARDTGHTVGELETKLTPREMVEWSVFYKLEYEAQERAYREASSKSRSRSR